MLPLLITGLGMGGSPVAPPVVPSGRVIVDMVMVRSKVVDTATVRSRVVDSVKPGES